MENKSLQKFLKKVTFDMEFCVRNKMKVFDFFVFDSTTLNLLSRGQVSVYSLHAMLVRAGSGGNQFLVVEEVVFLPKV
jgi:hypothetical protein